MSKRTLTQFLDDYEYFSNEGKKPGGIELKRMYIRENLNRLIDECIDENGILDLCDSRIFLNVPLMEITNILSKR